VAHLLKTHGARE